MSDIPIRQASTFWRLNVTVRPTTAPCRHANVIGIVRPCSKGWAGRSTGSGVLTGSIVALRRDSALRARSPTRGLRLSVSRFQEPMMVVVA